VTPDDPVSVIPNLRFKAPAEYQVADNRKFGADLSVFGSISFT